MRIAAAKERFGEGRGGFALPLTAFEAAVPRFVIAMRMVALAGFRRKERRRVAIEHRKTSIESRAVPRLRLQLFREAVASWHIMGLREEGHMADALLRLIAPRELALCFVLVVVAFCCRVDNAFMMMLDLQGAMPTFLVALCVGVLAGCLGAACRPARSRRSQMVWISVVTACSIAGLAVAGFVQMLPSLWCALAAGALVGFGLAGALCQWWSIYAPLPPAKLLMTMATSVFLAAVLW